MRGPGSLQGCEHPRPPSGTASAVLPMVALLTWLLLLLQKKETTFYFCLQPVAAGTEPIELAVANDGSQMADSSRGFALELF